MRSGTAPPGDGAGHRRYPRPSVNRLHEEFWALAGGTAPPVDFPDAAGVLPSALSTGELALGALACAAGAAAALAEARGPAARC